jgi:hypothetical protein
MIQLKINVTGADKVEQAQQDVKDLKQEAAKDISVDIDTRSIADLSDNAVDAASSTGMLSGASTGLSAAFAAVSASVAAAAAAIAAVVAAIGIAVSAVVALSRVVFGAGEAWGQLRKTVSLSTKILKSDVDSLTLSLLDMSDKSGQSVEELAVAVKDFINEGAPIALAKQFGQITSSLEAMGGEGSSAAGVFHDILREGELTATGFATLKSAGADVDKLLSGLSIDPAIKNDTDKLGAALDKVNKAMSGEQLLSAISKSGAFDEFTKRIEESRTPLEKLSNTAKNFYTKLGQNVDLGPLLDPLTEFLSNPALISGMQEAFKEISLALTDIALAVGEAFGESNVNVIDLVVGAAKNLALALRFVADNMDTIIPIVKVVAVILGALTALSFAPIVGALILLAGAVIALGAAVAGGYAIIKRFMNAVTESVAALSSLSSVATVAADTVFSAFTSALSPGAMFAHFAGLGSAATEGFASNFSLPSLDMSAPSLSSNDSGLFSSVRGAVSNFTNRPATAAPVSGPLNITNNISTQSSPDMIRQLVESTVKRVIGR